MRVKIAVSRIRYPSSYIVCSMDLEWNVICDWLIKSREINCKRMFIVHVPLKEKDSHNVQLCTIAHRKWPAKNTSSNRVFLPPHVHRALSGVRLHDLVNLYTDIFGADVRPHRRYCRPLQGVLPRDQVRQNRADHHSDELLSYAAGAVHGALHTGLSPGEGRRLGQVLQNAGEFVRTVRLEPRQTAAADDAVAGRLRSEHGTQLCCLGHEPGWPWLPQNVSRSATLRLSHQRCTRWTNQHLFPKVNPPECAWNIKWTLFKFSAMFETAHLATKKTFCPHLFRPCLGCTPKILLINTIT